MIHPLSRKLQAHPNDRRVRLLYARAAAWVEADRPVLVPVPAERGTGPSQRTSLSIRRLVMIRTFRGAIGDSGVEH